MEFFYDSTLMIPAIQMGMLLSITTVTLLFGRIKLALLVTYLFTLYWGYILNKDLFFGQSPENVCLYGWAYLFFGIFIVFFAVLGFLVCPD